MDQVQPSTFSADATAADHLLVRVPVVSAEAGARDARAAALARRDGAHVYVVGKHGELAGILSVTQLLALDDEEPIASHLQSPPATVRADEDQEHVALAAIRHGLTSVPVVDSSGHFLGIVPASALLRVLHHEHVEDIDRLSGILRQTEHAAHALEEPPSRRVRERLPWLLVGLLGSALATWIMSTFSAALEQHIAVAFFIPGIVYLADAIGTQTEAIAVRELSFQHDHGAGVFVDEMRTGLLLGLALALPAFPAVWWVMGDSRLAAAVAISLVVAGTAATAVGLGFPFVLARYGKDPALGSGPLATVLQDVLSLLAYLAAVKLFVQ